MILRKLKQELQADLSNTTEILLPDWTVPDIHELHA